MRGLTIGPIGGQEEVVGARHQVAPSETTGAREALLGKEAQQPRIGKQAMGDLLKSPCKGPIEAMQALIGKKTAEVTKAVGAVGALERLGMCI